MSGGSATSAFVVTNTAAGAAALTWALISRIHTGKVSVVGTATGAVAGLATITPAAGFVGPMPALIIGIVTAALCYGAIQLKNKLNLDDALDVWAVHGMGGVWGILATGLFVGIGYLTISDHVLEGVDRGGQIIRQLGTIGVTIVWAFVTTTIILFVLKVTMGIRVEESEEEQGLDVSQHGEEAYRT